MLCVANGLLEVHEDGLVSRAIFIELAKGFYGIPHISLPHGFALLRSSFMVLVMAEIANLGLS